MRSLAESGAGTALPQNPKAGDAARAPPDALAAEPRDGETLIRAENVEKHFPIKGGIFGRTQDHVKAVDGVTLDVFKGETLGIVGESGCGKTTLGRMLMHLIAATNGTIRYRGRELRDLEKHEPRVLRRRMQIVFQDPASSLNPRMTIRNTVGEPLLINKEAKGEALIERVKALLDTVGLKPEHVNRFPHEFSGGQKQRIGIARALALNPEFIVLDEPTSALDVSVQAQVLNLLADLQKEMGLTYVFITHALNVVNHISDRVAVMYLGKIVELSPTSGLFAEPLHPYTQALLSAIPEPDPKRESRKKRVILPGDVPSPVNPPSGCRFHPRCPIAKSVCKWDGALLAERALKAPSGVTSPLGNPEDWDVDRAGAVLDVPVDRKRQVEGALDRLLAADKAKYDVQFWQVLTTEDGKLRVDFEPPLAAHRGAGYADERKHQRAACYFAGTSITDPAAKRDGSPDREFGREIAPAAED